MINVNKFIQENYTEYLGDESFLQPITERNSLLWNKCKKLLQKEQEAGGVLDIASKTLSGINAYSQAYVDKDLELIVGFQANKPLQRIVNLYGGVRTAEQAAKAYGFTIDEDLKNNFQKFRKSHNEGVFEIYPPEVRKARHNKLLTGLPDSYGRGRIIGDYRRVALYGTDYLIQHKEADMYHIAFYEVCDESSIRLREEIAAQIKALKEMTEMAKGYGYDISRPAETAQEAIQWIYFAYLAGAKENNGAATSLGRVSTFIDIYIERDMEKGILDEIHAQELIDQFIMKLRFIRHLRTPEYDELFAGDPTWVTESIGGMGEDGRSLVTKTSFRFLHSLTNLGAAPEPNMTILWHEDLPKGFKDYCTKMSIQTSAIQYENDELMSYKAGSTDYGIACCVSRMTIGKQMQYFGARCNIAKVLLYAINEGKDERTGEVVVPGIPKLRKEYLDYWEVKQNFDKVLRYTITLYTHANNIIHYMHDKYAYEASQMALHDTVVERLMAFGLAGFSVTVDSFASIKFGHCIPIRDENGIATSFKIIKYPAYGNDIDEVDNEIGNALLEQIDSLLRGQVIYRDAIPTLSILTITSNVVYGKNTGATPDGREAWTPFAPGANPMHGRDKDGAIAALKSVAQLDYSFCQDGISNTFSISPDALGGSDEDRAKILTQLLDGYFATGGHHLNVNILNREMLLDAIEHPENYPNLTIRISGYAVRFNSLTDEQKREIVSRTFHGGL